MHRHILYMQVLASSRLENRGEEVLCDLGEGRKTVYKYCQIVYTNWHGTALFGDWSSYAWLNLQPRLIFIVYNPGMSDVGVHSVSGKAFPQYLYYYIAPGNCFGKLRSFTREIRGSGQTAALQGWGSAVFMHLKSSVQLWYWRPFGQKLWATPTTILPLIPGRNLPGRYFVVYECFQVPVSVFL